MKTVVLFFLCSVCAVVLSAGAPVVYVPFCFVIFSLVWFRARRVGVVLRCILTAQLVYVV